MLLNIDAIGAAPVTRDPFVYLVAEHAVSAEVRDRLGQDFPAIEKAGSFPLSELTYGPSFAELVGELRAAPFAQALGARLGVELGSFANMVTVRGRIARRDGGPHTDAAWKVVTVLLYLNDTWADVGGRLRLLRDSDVKHTIVEIPPTWGTLLAFVRSNRSWHGHLPAEGVRRVVQVNWVTTQEKIDAEIARHRRSSWLKRLIGRTGY
jgi:SM-20-related protein